MTQFLRLKEVQARTGLSRSSIYLRINESRFPRPVPLGSPHTVGWIADEILAWQQEQIRVQLSNNLQAIISQQLLPRAGAPGRIPANEIMLASPAIRNLIREAKTHQIPSMIQTSGNVGMITMDQTLRDLYLKGYVTLEEIFSRCQNPDELKKMINTPQQSQGAGNSARR